MPAGIWGSAFTVLLQRVLRERKLPSDTVDEMSNMGDLRDELSTSFRVLSIMQNIPVISVGSQMERSVSIWSDRNIREVARPLEVVRPLRQVAPKFAVRSF